MNTNRNWVQIWLLGVMLLPAVVDAQFRITINSDGTITINSYSGGGDVIIPAMTNGYPVTTIARGAFLSSSMTSIFIPYTVTNIGNTFDNNPQLVAINIDAQNPLWSSVDGVWFNKDQTTLVQFPEAKFGFTIPNTVTNIGSNAFVCCHNLTNIIIPGSVTSIGSGAFNICNITNITIPDSVTSIGDEAFSQCYYLANIKLPDSVTNIGSGLFVDCHALTNATLPGSITSIPSATFNYCIDLVRLTIPPSVTNIASSSFYACFSLNEMYFQGNAPAGFGIFAPSSGSNPTIFYLPGTTNWSPTYNSRPTVLWNPQAQTGDGSFGVQGNQFGFNITGTTNIPVVVEASTDLVSGAWTPLQSCSVTNGSIYFSDAQWTNYPGRFYRFRSP